jgi:hypothetical protein
MDSWIYPILVIALSEERERERERGYCSSAITASPNGWDDIDKSWSFRCHNIITELHFLTLLETSV